jgi:hypothetical protein
VHTRKAGGDGCTVTMTCSRSITTRPTDIMADGYHGRRISWPTDIMADTIGYITPGGPPICNICKASRRGAIVSQLSRHRGRAWGCHACESCKATTKTAWTEPAWTDTRTGDVPEAARWGKGKAQTCAA